jgi:hypothetical protein
MENCREQHLLSHFTKIGLSGRIQAHLRSPSVSGFVGKERKAKGKEGVLGFGMLCGSGEGFLFPREGKGREGEREETTMRMVGLTGGIASGKSTVSRQLQAQGIPVIDADKVAQVGLSFFLPTLSLSLQGKKKPSIQVTGRNLRSNCFFVFEIEQATGLRVGQQVDIFLVLSED